MLTPTSTSLYREAGSAQAKLLLLHGFPTSSHMFRDLIPLLSDRFHVVAPDLPGFGRTALRPRGEFTYSFDNLAKVIGRFTEVIGLDRFSAVYLRLWRADRVAHRAGASGADRRRSHFAEWQRL